MVRGGSFRGGRGGRGLGRGRGRGGRGGRGRGRGGGRKDSFSGQQRGQGYTEGYVPPPQPYPPPPPPQYGDYQNGASMYPSQQVGYAPLPLQQVYPPGYPEQQPFPPQQYQHYQDPYHQSQYQQPQGYAENRYNGNPPPYPMDTFQPQPVYQQPPPQYPQPPLPQHPPPFQPYTEDASRYSTNPPMPPAGATEYAGAAHARQQAYAPLPPNDTVSKTQPPAYQQQQQPSLPSYQQQQPPLPPMPQDARDWNVPPQPAPHWPPQPPLPRLDQHSYARDPNGPFRDRRQDRNPFKQHRTPPLSYICHNCNQPGHWKQHCPLFEKEGTSYQSFREQPAKPQDPRRNGVPYTNFPASLRDHKMLNCEPCAKTFELQSHYEAHVKKHVRCANCEFSACQRVVNVHYDTSHGQYVGDGLKEIEVEGQKFMVLLGNSADDIAKWREERRTKWLAMAREPKAVIKKRARSMSSDEDLEEGEIEEDEEAKAKISLTSAAMESPASVKESPAKKPRKTMLCKWFLRGQCRFDGASCKYSHDRSTFGCRVMMSKGSCTKGKNCPFSHDTTVVSGQRKRAQKNAKQRVLEQQWRGEQKSLLRKLLAKNMRLEQRQMLQIVHFLVANEFLQKEPVVTKVGLQNEEQAEASESITMTSKDAVMDEASECIENCEQTNAAAAACQAVEQTTSEYVLPVVEARACEVADIEEIHVRETKAEGVARVEAEIVNPEEVAAAEPCCKGEIVAEDKEENPAHEAYIERSG
ncbi:hypothetical protein PsorP6_010651 [Peronosclerospora sorghi]|uniref:Uncharacterized protein n=1 Tax=Peronosclerospora sorghi TaxID=230839 RepID=A0ACC0VXJ0_9STRA|nr:hypothetical protein PsorP6_010651 [Peronosclerospora sorghi]